MTRPTRSKINAGISPRGLKLRLRNLNCPKLRNESGKPVNLLSTAIKLSISRFPIQSGRSFKPTASRLRAFKCGSAPMPAGTISKRMPRMLKRSNCSKLDMASRNLRTGPVGSAWSSPIVIARPLRRNFRFEAGQHNGDKSVCQKYNAMSQPPWQDGLARALLDCQRSLQT
jgi:hypothetical protein